MKVVQLPIGQPSGVASIHSLLCSGFWVVSRRCCCHLSIHPWPQSQKLPTADGLIIYPRTWPPPLFSISSPPFSFSGGTQNWHLAATAFAAATDRLPPCLPPVANG
jgi:hypothetical protein